MQKWMKTAGYVFSLICIAGAILFLIVGYISLNNSDIKNDTAEDLGYTVEQVEEMLIIGTMIIVVSLLILGIVIIVLIHFFSKKDTEKSNTQNYDSNTFYYQNPNVEPNIQKECLLCFLLKYLKNPTYILHQRKKGSISKFKDVFRILSISIALAIFLSIFILLALTLVGYDQGDHALSDPIYDNPWVVISLGVILAPVLEELAFRMVLKFSPFRFSISLSFLCFFLISFFLSVFNFQISGVIYLIIIILNFSLVGCVLGFVLKEFVNNQRIINFYRRNFALIFYSSALVFATIHITNYGNFERIWFILPILVAPQFVGGVLMGFVRMKYGLRWAVFQHMAYNGIFFFLPFSIKYITSREASISVLFAIFVIIIGLSIFVSVIYTFYEFVTYKQEKKALNCK